MLNIREFQLFIVKLKITLIRNKMNNFLNEKNIKCAYYYKCIWHAIVFRDISYYSNISLYSSSRFFRSQHEPPLTPVRSRIRASVCVVCKNLQYVGI